VENPSELWLIAGFEKLTAVAVGESIAKMKYKYVCFPIQ
jgi:hypothetical protein